MTTLYRPVLIESAEQAEALPEGTVITHPEYHPQEKFAGLWGRNRNTNRQLAQQDGWTALVPIEAEEEWALIYDGEEPTPCADEADAREWARIDGEEQAPSRRYTTIWEETP